MKFRIILICLIASCVLQAQDAIFKVTDRKTGDPVEYVHIIYKSLVNNKTIYNTTNINGIAANIAQEPSYVTITFIGYESINDTIQPGKSYTYALESGSNDLEEIVLTAQYAPVSESNSVFKVKVINQDFFTNRGAINVEEALNTQLNIRLQQDGILGSSFKIQGLDGENVKILIDGVPVVGRLNGNVDLSQLNLNNVERIEVIEGPMSVNYGSNALAGAINIITKSPNNQQVGGSVNGMYESVGRYNFNAGINWGDKRNSFLLDLGRNFFEGWSEFDTTRNKDWNQKEQYFGQFKYNHKFKRLSISYSLNGLWEQIKDKGNRLGETSNHAFDNWFTTQRYINAVDLKFKAGPFTNSQILTSYTYYNRVNEQFYRNLVDLTQELISSDTTLVHNAMSRGTFATARDKNWNYQLGYEANLEQGSGQRISSEAGAFIDAGVFGSMNWTPSLRWSIQPGLRVSYNNNFKTPAIPSLHVRYNINESTLVRFSYAHGFRAPSIKELYLEFVDQNHDITGNTSLIPENSKNINASLIWRTTIANEKQSIKVEPAIYFNHITDKIQLVRIGSSSELSYTYENFAEYSTYGGKIEVNYNIHPDFSFGIGGGLLNYTNISELEGTPDFLQTPELNASFSYWRASKKFNLNVIYKYTGQTVEYVLNDNDQIVQSELPGYNWLDITATQKAWRNRLEIGIGIKNAFNITSISSSNGGSSGGAHGGGGTRNVSYGRTWFVRCGLKL